MPNLSEKTNSGFPSLCVFRLTNLLGYKTWDPPFPEKEHTLGNCWQFLSLTPCTVLETYQQLGGRQPGPVCSRRSQRSIWHSVNARCAVVLICNVGGQGEEEKRSCSPAEWFCSSGVIEMVWRCITLGLANAGSAAEQGPVQQWVSGWVCSVPTASPRILQEMALCAFG